MNLLRKIKVVPDFIWQGVLSSLRNNDSVMAGYLRRKLHHTSCQMDTGVFVKNWKNFKSGEGCCLYHGCYILNHHGQFILGDDSHLGAGCYVNACHGLVRIGSNVAVGPGTKIIAYSNHYALGGKVTEEKITADIVIGNNVLIGANCTILPGAIIEDNVIAAAGAVVKGKLESNSIYGGVPCQKIKSGWFRKNGP